MSELHRNSVPHIAYHVCLQSCWPKQLYSQCSGEAEICQWNPILWLQRWPHTNFNFCLLKAKLLPTHLQRVCCLAVMTFSAVWTQCSGQLPRHFTFCSIFLDRSQSHLTPQVNCLWTHFENIFLPIRVYQHQAQWYKFVKIQCLPEYKLYTAYFYKLCRTLYLLWFVIFLSYSLLKWQLLSLKLDATMLFLLQILGHNDSILNESECQCYHYREKLILHNQQIFRPLNGLFGSLKVFASCALILYKSWQQIIETSSKNM